MRGLVIFCAAMLFASGLVAQSTGLRQLSKPYEAKGWEAVGRLEIGGQGYCTATLIAPDQVLTAAHCVYDMARGTAYGPQDLMFRAGVRNGKAVAVRGIAQIAAHRGFDPTSPMTSQNVRHDLALLRLDSPISTANLDPFVLHSDAVRPGPVSIVSYGRGRGDAQSRERDCQMTGQQGAVLAFDCDVTFGSSGAPVFSHLNGRGRIMSVISGMVTIEGKKVALGMALPALIPQLRAELRRGQSLAPKAKIKRLRVGSGTARSGGGAKFVRVPSN